ncbi:hypothetical protein LAZ67_3003562 [Cordylochernes scorpioides]|uniref:Peptidase A2 domain-containing protein n=1 Tax=Cordylochernes scorpioides TaxID=51811 RepID=A0ABY6K8K6_9ARAC|nr:hypothetical protein LAZ67_3003562 [Cordylochernes scorpioides]
MWHLLYDTGSQVSIIDSEKCKVLKENWDDALKTLRIVSVTGQEQTLTRVKTCRIGNENGIELGEIRFWLMSLGDKAYDGILGINDIRRFNIPLPAIRERCNMISLKPEDRDYVDLSYVASVHRPMVSSSFEEKSVKRIENEAVKLPPTEFNRNCECSAGSVNSFRKPTWAERLRVMQKAKETVRQFMSGNSAKKLMNPRPPYSRSFDRGDLVMLAVPKTEGYSNVYGPFRVEARVSDVNFRFYRCGINRDICQSDPGQDYINHPIHHTKPPKETASSDHYTTGRSVVHTIPRAAALHTQDSGHCCCCDGDAWRHLRLFFGHNNNNSPLFLVDEVEGHGLTLPVLCDNAASSFVDHLTQAPVALPRRPPKDVLSSTSPVETPFLWQYLSALPLVGGHERLTRRVAAAWR